MGEKYKRDDPSSEEEHRYRSIESIQQINQAA
jgi:hypothetical protein